MPKKSLIMYASWTGNTEKVALRFKEVFEKKGWECDMFKVDHKTDIENSALDIGEYDFLCVGSPVVHSKCIEEVTRMLGRRRRTPGTSEGKPVEARSNQPYENNDFRGYLQLGGWRMADKIDFGPNDKKGIVFATYAGLHLAPPKEAEPALTAMACVMEHEKFQCIGKFCCPGKWGELQSAWIKDLPKRPNERDLLKAEIFIEEIIEAFG